MFFVRRRPTCEDEMKQFGRRLTCGGKEGAARRTARPGGPREDLVCRRMDVD